MFLCWVYSLGEVLGFITPEAEMREVGILSAAGLTHWQEIESYTWEAWDARGDVLRLQLRKTWRFLSIKVPVEQKARVEAILNSRLPEGERIAVWTLR